MKTHNVGDLVQYKAMVGDFWYMGWITEVIPAIGPRTNSGEYYSIECCATNTFTRRHLSHVRSDSLDKRIKELENL